MSTVHGVDFRVCEVVSRHIIVAHRLKYICFSTTPLSVKYQGSTFKDIHHIARKNPNMISMLLIVVNVIAFFFCVAHAAQCLSSINDIYEAEKVVTNTNIQRKYTICPNRRYKIGSYDYYGKNLLRGSKSEKPLPLRPNIKIQCGSDDDEFVAPSCFIDSGDLQVDGTATHGLGGGNLGIVEIVGFVFENARKHSFWVTKPGSVTFQHCEWRNNKRSSGPIILDYFDNFGKNDALVVSFEDCRFRENRYLGYGAQTAIVTGSSRQNTMLFTRTSFENNNMQYNNSSPERRTHLIESLGKVSIKNSCFVNNKVTAANVVVYNNHFTSSEVVHGNDQGGSLCRFASVFRSYSQYKSLKPSCIPIDSSKFTCDLVSDIPQNPIEPVNQYVPFTINALEYDSAFEKDESILQGGCNRDGYRPINAPDAQNTKDPVCLQYGGCHVSHTSAGEYLVYRFAHSETFNSNGEVRVDISVRVASNRQKKFRLELMYGGNVEASKTLTSEGFGYQDFSTITWRKIPLMAGEPFHSIRFWFEEDNINFCSIGIELSDPISSPSRMPTPAPSPGIPPTPTRQPTFGGIVPPIVWGALDYDMAYEMSPNTSMGGCNERGDGVDAQPTSDSVCISRDNSNCNIGWWDDGEYFIYRFTIPQGEEGMYIIRARAATTRPNKYIGMDLTTETDNLLLNATSLIVPNQGFQSFHDVEWQSVFLTPNDYSLKVKSMGKTNLCSVAVLSDEGNGPDENDNYSIVVPGHYSAMYYTDDSFDKTSERQGNCPIRVETSVDAKLNSDTICQEAQTDYDHHCNIAFTETNEFLVYDFKKARSQDFIKVSLRLASRRKRQVRVDLYSADMENLESKVVTVLGKSSWDVYDDIVVWDQIQLGSEEDFKLKIEFVDGQVNLCSFRLE